jgi:uncharacterized protein YjeT (DUF2065 family)
MVGYLSLAAGVLLLGFPEPSRQLIAARAEFAQLSHTALRLLGFWYLLTGVLLVLPTMKRAELAAKIDALEGVSHEIRKAA